MSPKLPWDPIAEARQHWRNHGWADAADGMAAVTSIMRVQQMLIARVEGTLKPFGISFARFEMLRVLGFTQEGRLSMRRARQVLQVHPASITSVVNRLESDGLVQRSAHPGDGRSVIVELTPAGRELVERATVALNREVFLDTGLPDEDAAALTRVLADFRRRAGDFADPDRAPEPL